MIVDEMELVRRLGEVEPLPAETFERARTLLHAAVALDGVGEPGPSAPRRRRRPRPSVVVRSTIGTGIVAAAAAVALVVTSTAEPPAGTNHPFSSRVTPSAPAAPGASAGRAAPLMRLADSIQADTTAPLPGDATLVIRTQSYSNGTSSTEADLYADNGEYFSTPTEAGLPAAIAEHADVGDGVPAREIKAAEDAVNGDLATARHEMAVAPFANGVGPTNSVSAAAQKSAIEQRIAADPNIPAAQKAAIEQKMTSGQNTPAEQRAHTDNYIWMDSLDTLSEGAGNPEVRIGVLRILSTLPEVKVTDTTTGGQPTLTLTASAPALPANYQEALTINATTGVPVSFTGGVPGQTPGVTVTYQVSRVSMANIAAGRF